MKKLVLGSILAVTVLGLSFGLGNYANSNVTTSGDMQVAEIPVGI
ncbi:hypothetical protein P8918_13500 [Bacillus spizizenii]|nr:hypothetical protein [Bacillus spizizenii]